MGFWQRLRLNTLALNGSAESERGLDEELRFHVDMETERNREKGLSEKEARRIALRDFGGIEVTKEAVRDTFATRWIADFMHDLQFSVRALIKRPAYSVATIVAISVAATTIAVALLAMRQIWWTPLPYAESDHIVVFFETDLSNGLEHQGVSPGNVLEWKKRTTAFEYIAVAEPSALNTTVNDRPAIFSAWAVSRGFFETMGLTPMLGRTFDQSQYELDIATEVLLTYRGWTRIFGRDKSIVGETLETDNGKMVIVGVLPSDVDLPTPRDFWLPQAIQTYHEHTRSGSWMTGVGRLKPGHTLENGQADISRVAAAIGHEYPESNSGMGVIVRPLKEQLLGGIEPAVKALGIAAACFFLAACATIASMFLTRLYAQSSELSIRSALGAHPAVLVRQGVAELLIICLVSAVSAVLLSLATINFLTSALPDNLPLLSDLQPDLFAVGTAFAVASLIVVCCAVFPLLKIARKNSSSLFATARSTGKRTELRARSALIALQVAVAVIVFVGATLMVRSLVNFIASDIGFEVENRVSLQVISPNQASQQEMAKYFDELMVSMSEVSGVEQVAGVSALPFHPSQIDPESTFTRVDDLQIRDERLSTFSIWTTPGYFELMGIPIKSGRAFSKFDTSDSAQVAVINQAMADRYWPNGNAIGRRLNINVVGNPMMVEIVGVTENTRPFSFDSPARPELYVPLAQAGFGTFTLVAKTIVAPETLLPALQSAIWSVAPQQAIYHTATVDSLVSKSAAPKNFATRILGAFAIGAVSLAVLGIYSLINYAITLRMRELGIRMAIGASLATIQKSIAQRTFLLMLAGAIPALIVAAIAATQLEPLLYGVEPFDIQTYLSAGLFIVTVGIAAALIPLWRASRHSVASLLNAP